jgi:hypothetical protein
MVLPLHCVRANSPFPYSDTAYQKVMEMKTCHAKQKLKRKRKEPNVFIAEYAGGLARQNIRPFQAA